VKIFCDTNVLIAAFRAGHPQHNSARPVVERIRQGKDEGFVAAHSLAEVYSVLTRMPAPTPPTVAWHLISENVMKGFTVVALTAGDYAAVLESAAADGIDGGRTYDALLLKAAEKSGAARIVTFNVAHFQALAPQLLKTKIMAP
jgi:predicted nucleic acid-binding protein